MESIMSKWSKKFGKILTAAAISAFLAVSSLAVPIAASAARVNTDGVTIRNGASRDDGAIGSLDEGTEVTILETVENDEGETWYYIQLENGNTGYVFSSLLDASDEEIAAAGGAGGGEEQAQEEQPQEEPKEEPAQEPAQEQNSEAQPAAEDQQTQEASAAATEAPATQGGEYDATKDPNAAFRVSYDTDESGNGEWYVHNDDNGSKWKVSDLQGQGGSSANAKADGVPRVWRTLAILFGLLVIALVAFVLFLLKSIRDGRSKTTRGRALEAAAAGRDDDDEDEDDEYYFEDDDDEEPAEEEEDLPDEKPSETNESSETDAASDSDTPSEADQAQQKSTVKAEEKPIVNTDSTITMDVSSETEVTEIPAEEIEAAIAATTVKIEKNISDQNNSDQAKPVQKVSAPEEQAAPAPAPAGEVQEQESDYVDEELDNYESDADEDPDADDYDDEDDDYVDEDYDDDGYEDEEYEEDDDDEDDTRGANRRARSSSKGGFFGFLKKMFGSDSKEDAEDEDEDFDDYEDEPEEHEFDEYKEYPEDVDLLPKEETDEDDDPADDEEDISDNAADPAAGGRGRLNMQRVMKNVSYKEEEADFSDDDDDLSDSLYDDDDDMEYSFISNTRNKK